MPVTRSSFLLRFRQGADEVHWREFLDLYRPLIERTIRRSGMTDADVDDILQDVLIQLLKALPGFDYQKDRGRFRSWLRRVTLNKIHDCRRRQREIAWPECGADIPDPAVSPDEWRAAFRLEVLRFAIRTARGDVRERTWQCFYRHVLEQHSAAEVSRQVGVTENAVYVNSSRVIDRIRKICLQHGEDPGHAEFRLPE
jgi:RNA polymerase sigma-70 factor (ECF subfamily)